MPNPWLCDSEPIACFVARPIELLARGSAIFVRLLTASSNLVLKLFGGKDAGTVSFISVDEVKSLIREGAARGIFNETEKELIHSVFEFTDTPVKAVMKPSTEIHAIEVHKPWPKWQGFCRQRLFPRAGYEGDLDKVTAFY